MTKEEAGLYAVLWVQLAGALLQKEYTLERLAGIVHALLEQRRE